MEGDHQRKRKIGRKGKEEKEHSPEITQKHEWINKPTCKERITAFNPIIKEARVNMFFCIPFYILDVGESPSSCWQHVLFLWIFYRAHCSLLLCRCKDAACNEGEDETREHGGKIEKDQSGGK